MKNVGLVDRIIRIIFTGLIFYAFYVGWTTGWIAILSAFVTVLLLVTAFIGQCPIYRWLSIRFNKNVRTTKK